MEDVIIKVKGMTCGHCEKAVHDAVTGVNGVTKVSVNLEKGEVKVSYDTSITGIENIKEAILASGYKVEEEAEVCPLPVKPASELPGTETKAAAPALSGEVKKITIGVTGMTCASCAQNIEKALNKLDGVNKASVNFSLEKASVEYDSAKG